MNKVYLGLGTNLGDRVKNIKSAIQELSAFVELKKCSSIWETSPWGSEDAGDKPPRYFLNCVVLCETQQTPLELLKTIHSIEKRMGRERKEKFGPRIIDIDILFYNNLVLECRSKIINTPMLTIPHSLLHKRKFVLLPLSEIADSLIHPVLGKSVKELLQLLESEEECRVFKVKELKS